jgi:G3E family GTPase
LSIPLTVIGGFLGSGKTTLLNHWLRHADGKRLAVLVNDFGAMNIDAALIESTSGDTVALTNGCVCCQIGDDLSRALIDVLESGTAFDAVVIEASGVSDPWRIAQLGRADPGLYLDGVIVLVDASAVLLQSRDRLLSDTLERQLKAADLVVVNKSDLVDEAERGRVRHWIKAVAGQVQVQVPMFETTNAEVPLPMLTGLAMPQLVHRVLVDNCVDRGDHHHDHDDPRHGSIFDTWSIRPSSAFDLPSLQGWIKNAPIGLLRLKGFVRTIAVDGAESWSELQFAGRHGSLRRATSPVHDDAALVAIGLRGQLPAEALTRFFGR